MVGFHHSEESKRKISEKMKGANNPNYGITISDECRARLLSYNLGKRHTEEHKKKISESLRGRHYSTDKQKQAARQAHIHPVEREDGKIFESVEEAAISVGVTYSAISNAIRRNQRSGGYHWKYVDDI